jgi:hypothetical protein
MEQLPSIAPLLERLGKEKIINVEELKYDKVYAELLGVVMTVSHIASEVVKADNGTVNTERIGRELEFAFNRPVTAILSLYLEATLKLDVITRILSPCKEIFIDGRQIR